MGLELGNNAPADHRTGRQLAVRGGPRSRVAGFSHAGQSCISTQRIYVQRAPGSTLHSRDWPNGSSCWSSATPSTRRPRSRRSSRRASATGLTSWIAEADSGGASLSTARSEPTACLFRRAGGCKPDMKVCGRGVRSGRGGPDLRQPRRGHRASQRHELRAPGRDLHVRPRQGDPGGAHARLRRRPHQRGADLARRPDALRRRARQRQHT